MDASQLTANSACLHFGRTSKMPGVWPIGRRAAPDTLRGGGMLIITRRTWCALAVGVCHAAWPCNEAALATSGAKMRR